MYIVYLYFIIFGFFWIIPKVTGIINTRFLNLNPSLSFLILGSLYCVSVVYTVAAEHNWDPKSYVFGDGKSSVCLGPLDRIKLGQTSKESINPLVAAVIWKLFMSLGIQYFARHQQFKSSHGILFASES